jgi:metal-dependent amidase/aminoacylase/carboxypeptidase family protein
MASKEDLKKRVEKAIDRRSKEIIEIGEYIWKNPELGFKEFKTARAQKKLTNWIEE